MRRLIINADDYAMAPGIDEAIVELAHRGIVTSTSAMVLSPRWPYAGRQLNLSELDCGLHLDLTSEFAHASGAGWSLGRLLVRTHTGQIDRIGLRGSIERQLDRFEDALNEAPRFVDGHEHVHQLPLVRDLLMQVLDQRYGAQAAFVALRSCMSRRWRGGKAALIAYLGAGSVTRRSARERRLVNSDFVGVYDFSADVCLPDLWRRWLADLRGPWPLAMCHVSKGGGALTDSIQAARSQEYAWLASEAFWDLCAEYAIVPSRWPHPWNPVHEPHDHTEQLAG